MNHASTSNMGHIERESRKRDNSQQSIAAIIGVDSTIRTQNSSNVLESNVQNIADSRNECPQMPVVLIAEPLRPQCCENSTAVDPAIFFVTCAERSSEPTLYRMRQGVRIAVLSQSAATITRSPTVQQSSKPCCGHRAVSVTTYTHPTGCNHFDRATLKINT